MLHKFLYGMKRQLKIKKLSYLMIVSLNVTVIIFVQSMLTSVYAAQKPSSDFQTYIDKKLNFNMQIPTGWIAYPQPGKVNTNNEVVNFINPQLKGVEIEIGVMRSQNAAKDFSLYGHPSISIGGYPSLQLDVLAQQQTKTSCLVRVMLAHNDIVLGRWCSVDASQHKQQFEALLSSYHDQTLATLGANVIQPLAVTKDSTCIDVINSGENSWGYLPPKPPAGEVNGDATFGAERVYPNDATWTNSFGSGVAVCDDYYTTGNQMWENSYLFQCVELANRFISGEWGLLQFDVNAANYYDYYDNSGFHQGRARTLFVNQVQLSDDSSQGTSAFAPVPGDLLIFQDVNNVSQGWTSGLIFNGLDNNNNPIYDAGHVVVITNVASDHVDVVQQNWHNGEIHSFPLSKSSSGYHIADNSGMSGRITRGWIHFNANPHNINGSTAGSVAPQSVQPSPTIVRESDNTNTLFMLGKDGHIWWNGESSAHNWNGWQWFTNTSNFASSPAVVNESDGTHTLFAVDKDGRMWWNGEGSAHQWNGWQWFSNNTDYAAVTPTVVNESDGTHTLIAVGKDGRMWWNGEKSTPHQWNGWQWFSSNTDYAASTPAVVFESDKTNTLFALGKDGRMWWNGESSAHNWNGWQWFSDSIFAASPAVVNESDGTHTLIAVGKDGRMWWNGEKSTPHQWNGWQWFSNNTNYTGVSPAVVNESDGTHTLIAVGTDGRMWWNGEKSTPHQWNGWQWFSNTTDYAASTPTVVFESDKTNTLFALGKDGRMWWNGEASAHNWNGWQWFSTTTDFGQ